MAGSALSLARAWPRTLWAWFGAVFLVHGLVLAGLRVWLAPDAGLRPLAVPMMTRTLQAAADNVSAPATRVAEPTAPPPEFVQPPVQRPTSPASSAQLDGEPLAAEAPLPMPAAQATAEPVAARPTAPPEPAPELPRAPSGLETEISAGPARPSTTGVLIPNPTLPAGGTHRVASLADWPSDTRIHYWVEGHFGGSVRGPAEVRWLRQDTQYEASIEISIRRTFLSGSFRMTSQGTVTPQEIRPQAYEEKRGTSVPRQVRVDEQGIRLQDGRVVPRPPGVQDTASQFIALTHRFATGRDALEVGRSVQVWLARPGGVDLWTYDIVSRDHMDTTQLGRIEAYHLKPRPLSNPRGNIYPDIWFSPALQHLPVRIRLSMGEDAWLDLKVERIEQR